MPTALLTGISGQDGSYLAELLLEKGYQVHGIVMAEELADPTRRLFRIQRVLDQVHLYVIDLLDFNAVNNLIREIQPTECYHLAAQSFVSYSLDNEFGTLNTNIHGTHNILAAIKTNTASAGCRPATPRRPTVRLGRAQRR